MSDPARLDAIRAQLRIYKQASLQGGELSDYLSGADIDWLVGEVERLRRPAPDHDGCPLCGSTRFAEDPVDVSTEGRIRFVPGLRSCLDCHGGGAPVLLAEVERLRGLLQRLEWGCHGDCPACGGNRMHEFSKLTPGGHEPDCEWAAMMHR